MSALTRLRSIRYFRLYAGALGHALAVLDEWRLGRQVKGGADLRGIARLWRTPRLKPQLDSAHPKTKLSRCNSTQCV
jgi:hypothetical protein